MRNPTHARSAIAPFGDLDESLIHPRNYGCFPNIFVKYVQEEKLLTLKEAVRKRTSFSAQRLGLHDRGLLRPGMWADIVIFTQGKVEDKTTY